MALRTGEIPGRFIRHRLTMILKWAPDSWSTSAAEPACPHGYHSVLGLDIGNRVGELPHASQRIDARGDHKRERAQRMA